MANKRIAAAALLSGAKVEKRQKKTAKTDQRWKYPGGNIVRKSSTMVNGRTYTDPKDPGHARRRQESNFFITINSNKSPSDEREMSVGRARMAEMLRRLSDYKMIAKFIRFGPRDVAYADDRFADIVESVEWSGAIETGDQQHRLHAHAWLTIVHYSQIHINVPVLMQFARREYNLSLKFGDPMRMTGAPYVHVKLLPQSDWADIMSNYIKKGMAAETPRGSKRQRVVL